MNASHRQALASAPPAGLERERMVSAVHRWVAEHGRPPRVVDWDPALARRRGQPELAERFERDGHWPRFTAIRRHFGGLSALLRAAGYPPAPRKAARYRVEWTKAEILEAIRRWTELYGEPPTMSDWDPSRARVTGEAWRIERYDAGEWPSTKSVRNRFGRLSDAVAAAGLVPRQQGQRRVPEEPVLDPGVLLHVAAVRGSRDKRAPSHRLGGAVERVVAARDRGTPSDLRVALVEVAAAAMDWAESAAASDTVAAP